MLAQLYVESWMTGEQLLLLTRSDIAPKGGAEVEAGVACRCIPIVFQKSSTSCQLFL